MEELVSCIEAQEVEVYDNDIYVKDGIGESDTDEPTKSKEHKLGGPDFRKKKVKVEENEAVMEFQKSGDLRILETIYLNRIPTLNYWARKNRHLDNNSFQDIKGELTRIFLKAVKQYKSKRNTKIDGKSETAKTDFNTYLYTSFNYALCNIYNRKKAKKRTPYPSENTKLANMLLSLDYVYGHSDDGGFTLKDIIADKATGKDGKVTAQMQIEEMLDVLSHDCPDVTKNFLRQISEGRSISSLLKEYKVREGKVKTTTKIIKKINNSRRPCVRIVANLIAEEVPERFKLVDFYTNGCDVYYTIEMHKTKETDVILSRIRKLKKNKDFYLDKIKVM